MRAHTKDLVWLGSSLADVRAFADEARKIAGHQLHLVQLGLQPVKLGRKRLRELEGFRGQQARRDRRLR